MSTPIISASNSDDFFMLIESSTDPDYGYTEAKPVQVGGAAQEEGPYHERKYLNGLRGPNGEDVTYRRIMSCCHFKTPNGYDGVGLLDVYEVNWEGAEKPVRLYLNMYDASEVLVPVGLTSRVR